MVRYQIEDKVLRDYAMPSIDEATTSILRSVVQVTHFEIKPAIIQMIQNIVQFDEMVLEDPTQACCKFS